MASIKLFIITAAFFIVVICKRYDVAEEGKKLYGENMESLLRKFRRTPMYMTILNDQWNGVIQEFDDSLIYIYYHYLNEAKLQCYNIIDDNNSGPDDNATTTTKSVIRSKVRQKGRVIGYRYNENYRRQFNQNEAAPLDNMTSSAEYLNVFSVFARALTAEQHNKVKEVAFSYALKTITDSINGVSYKKVSKDTEPPNNANQKNTNATENNPLGRLMTRSLPKRNG